MTDSDAGRTGQAKLRADIEKILSPAVDCRAPYAKVMIDAIVARAALPGGAEPPDNDKRLRQLQNDLGNYQGQCKLAHKEFDANAFNAGWLAHEKRAEHSPLPAAAEFQRHATIGMDELIGATRLPSPGAQPPSDYRKQVAAILNRHANPGTVNAQMEDLMPFLSELIEEEVCSRYAERTSAVAPPTPMEKLVTSFSALIDEGDEKRELATIRSAYDCGNMTWTEMVKRVRECSSAVAPGTSEATLELIHQVGKLLQDQGEAFRLDHAELLDAYAAVQPRNEMSEAFLEAFNKRRAVAPAEVPMCLGYPKCDGTLPGEPHEPECPMFEAEAVPREKEGS